MKQKKMLLNKSTVANLQNRKMAQVKGGWPGTTHLGPPCDNGDSWYCYTEEITCDTDVCGETLPEPSAECTVFPSICYCF
jgi:hypothetical protein